MGDGSWGQGWGSARVRTSSMQTITRLVAPSIHFFVGAEMGRSPEIRGRGGERSPHARGRLAALGVGVGLVASVWAQVAAAQCRPPASSNEAKLLAFYEAPIVFSTVDAPVASRFGDVSLTGELTGVPSPSTALTRTSVCFVAKQEGSHLAPVLPRLRLTVALPAGFSLEGSYLPPVTVDRAKPNLGSLALAYAHALIVPPAGMSGTVVTLGLRAHGTMGGVTGPITCAPGVLQQTNPVQPCYGTRPSSDTFHPTSVGGEGTVGVAHGVVTAFGGVGYTWLAPHFRVGFTDLNGATDRTLVEVDLQRAALLGGVSVRIAGPLDAAGEVYSVPADVTTWRLSARYRLP